MGDPGRVAGALPAGRRGDPGKKKARPPARLDLSGWAWTLARRLAGGWKRFWPLAAEAGRLLKRWLAGPRVPRPGRPQLQLEEDEMRAVVAQILTHPWMGGKKGAGNLIHDRLAWLGAASYDELRREIARRFGGELASRRPACPLAPFELPRADGLNQVWSSDLVEVKAWGMHFDAGSFMDVFNQEHLALGAVLHAADSAFVTELFEAACQERGGAAPTVCTKTDRGAQYRSHTFEQALAGRTHHVKIPAGCPWFNGSSERGNRDLKAVLYGLVARTKRPRPGRELETMQALCARARRLLNECVARPSLGNVTPAEVALGVEKEVKRGNREFVTWKHEERKRRPATTSWRELLESVLQAERRSTGELLRHLRLMKRDYAFLAR